LQQDFLAFSTPEPRKMRLSIIIPAYNEAARLGASLETIFAYLNRERPDTEVIIVDDGSRDDTAGIAEQYAKQAGQVQASVIRVNPNRGKGHAVRVGLLAARAPVALFSDADLSTPIEELPKLIAPIEAGEKDVTFGSRALDRSLIGTRQPWRREQGGKIFNLVARVATGLPFWDTQCGFKAFRLDVCRPLIEGATIERFGFDVEYLYIMQRAGLRLEEIPVRWNHCDGSTVSVGRDSLRMLGEIRLIRRQARHGVYDQALARARELAAYAPKLPQAALAAASL
jgi:glycosyltransferase involved in cell wall biosynthesis